VKCNFFFGIKKNVKLTFDIMNIEIVSGSPRKNSVTNRIAQYLKDHLIKTSVHRIGIIDLRNYNLPHLQEVFTSVENTPEEFKPLAKKMFAADAFILVTPEYNGSYAPAMKNLFDHFPKQHHKVFGLATGTTGSQGGMRAAMQLQQLIFALFGIGSPYMLITPNVEKKFDEHGNLIDPSFQQTIDVFINEFLWLAEKIKVPYVNGWHKNQELNSSNN
jgi:NAD(P)H-dependent FMN reductase